MKINSAQIGSAPALVKIQARQASKSFAQPISSFKELQKQLSQVSNQGAVALASFEDIQVLKTKLLSGQSFQPRDLLLYQISAAQFGLSLEIISKIAEAAMSSMRKFQNQQ